LAVPVSIAMVWFWPAPSEAVVWGIPIAVPIVALIAAAVAWRGRTSADVRDI
jgi:hypothetical protein